MTTVMITPGLTMACRPRQPQRFARRRGPRHKREERWLQHANRSAKRQTRLKEHRSSSRSGDGTRSSGARDGGGTGTGACVSILPRATVMADERTSRRLLGWPATAIVHGRHERLHLSAQDWPRTDILSTRCGGKSGDQSGGKYCKKPPRAMQEADKRRHGAKAQMTTMVEERPIRPGERREGRAGRWRRAPGHGTTWRLVPDAKLVMKRDDR